MSESEQYASYFSAGMRVGVGIPLHNNELFRDWAIILVMEEDVVELQLSRDVLPTDVDLQTGKVLEIRCGKDGKGYRCSGVFISEGEDGSIHVKLTGDVNSSELREYYRIEAFLPFRIETSREHNLDAVLKEWRSRKQIRSEFETQRKEEFENKRRELIFRTAEGEFDVEDGDPGQTRVQDQEVLELVEESWNEVMASAINLSGGGFRFVTADHYELGDLVFQEVFLPTSPPRIMESVARVAFKSRNYSIKSDEEYFNIATQFLFIDERDRDAIVRHISSLELMRIRLLRQNYLMPEGSAERRFFTRFKMIGVALILLASIITISLYFQRYTRSNIKSEIQETFESGIRKYLERFK